MSAAFTAVRAAEHAEIILVAGLVQGVGFRPTVWRLAHHYGMRGSVSNDGQGVRIHVCGATDGLEAFVQALRSQAPPLSRVDHINRTSATTLPADVGFYIVKSATTEVRTGVVPDAATCTDCRTEIFDPFGRRYRYPFTNCTHCGPRLSIIRGIPYDRASTTMRAFDLCAACQAEYDDPGNRRFHAQPIACHACGPHAWLERADGAAIALDTLTTLDAVDAACSLLQRGEIVAIKGLGGFQLACDATNELAVARLRERKHRQHKPFALMARDLDMVRSCCDTGAAEEALLQSPAAPIVLMAALAGNKVAASVAPGLKILGFMLPNTPLHHLMLRRMNRPIVLTSGNLSDEPQCIDNNDAKKRLGGICTYFLLHNRDVARRVDDSVAWVNVGRERVLRRARGYAPATLALPPGFAKAPPILALGAELKNTFCLLREGVAVLSHHIGDLENAPTHTDYQRAIVDYLQLFDQQPQIVVVDKHPEYLSAKLGRTLQAQNPALCLTEIQHHHAHIAACMAENNVPLDSGLVIGIAMDGLGWGDDGSLWGGEFFLADYRTATRVATFKPVPMLGGGKAVFEPWRNTYAHLVVEMGWARFAMNYEELELFRFLDGKPRDLLNSMLKSGVNSPLASSCGRLFDAVAAAAGVCREHAAYEGQAAIEFEALADPVTLNEEDDELAYPFAIPRLKDSNLPYIEPLGMWQALLGDLILGAPVGVISARFHKGLAITIARMADKLSRHESPDEPIKTVALSGGVFQNRLLLAQLVMRLEAQGFKVLTHSRVPANDGGIAFGQAVVAAARWTANQEPAHKNKEPSCA